MSFQTVLWNNCTSLIILKKIQLWLMALLRCYSFLPDCSHSLQFWDPCQVLCRVRRLMTNTMATSYFSSACWSFQGDNDGENGKMASQKRQWGISMWREKYLTTFQDLRRDAITLADCGYVSCTHRTVRKVSGGLSRAERDVMPRSMSGSPWALLWVILSPTFAMRWRARGCTHRGAASNAFICNPVQSKVEWDYLQG